MLRAAQTMTAAELCHRHGIAVYQVGQVYGEAPPEFLKKFFVSVTGDSFGEFDIEAIPLADTRAEAYEIAANSLKLWSIEK